MEGGRWPYKAWLELLKAEIVLQRQDPRDPALFTRSMQVPTGGLHIVTLSLLIVGIHQSLSRRPILYPGGIGQHSVDLAR